MVETAPAVIQKRPRGRGSEIPIFLRVQARNMYLNQCLPYRAISEKTGLPVETLERLAHREGWTALRKAAKERIMKAADARCAAVETEITETVVAMASEHTIKSLEKVGEALERNDRDAARDSQAYSATAKNLVGVVKALRDPAAQVESAGPTVNFFLAPMRSAEPAEPKPVDAIPV